MDILQEIYLLEKEVERKWQNKDCIVGAKKFAELLTTIVKNCNIPDVVVPKGTLVCKDDKKSICNNPMSHECCNKHHKRI